MKHITTTHTTVQCNPGSDFHSGLYEAAAFALSTNQKIYYQHNGRTYLVDPSKIINHLIDCQIPPDVEGEVERFMESCPDRKDRSILFDKIRKLLFSDAIQ